MGTLFIVDDHTLIRKSLINILESSGHVIVGDAENGIDMIEQLKSCSPDIVIVDCVMPLMDGIETAEWLRVNRPEIKVLALSMNSDDLTVIRMLKAGARGFILKGAKLEELQEAISEVDTNGFFYSDFISDKLPQVFQSDEKNRAKKEKATDIISEREMEFLKLSCSELTYKEIADQMSVSVRTVDGYRESLFEKLNIKSRVGLVLFAIQHGVMKFN